MNLALLRLAFVFPAALVGVVAAAHTVTFNAGALTGSTGSGPVPWGVLNHPVGGELFTSKSSQAYSLEPGKYWFATRDGARGQRFEFAVTEAGTVACPPGATWLAGCGTSVITVTGVRITVDATALTGQNGDAIWGVFGSTPRDQAPVKEARVIPGIHTFVLQSDVPSSTRFEFTVDDAGHVGYPTSDQPLYLDGMGTDVLQVIGLRIVIDGTALTGPFTNGTTPLWSVFGSTPLDETQEVREARVIPGIYHFRESTGLGWNGFTFQVSAAARGVGSVSYEPDKTFLQGAGTDTLTIAGFTITVDATALTGETPDDASWWVANVTVQNTDPVKTATLVPGRWPFIETACLGRNTFFFTITPQGRIEVMPEDSGFASADGSRLTVQGFDIQLNGCQAPEQQLYRVCGAMTRVADTDCTPRVITVIPGTYYMYRDNTKPSPFQVMVSKSGIVDLPPEVDGKVFGRGRRYLYLGGSPETCLLSSCANKECEERLARSNDALDELEAELRKFTNLAVDIKGMTAEQRVQHLVAAINKLNPAQKRALIKALAE